MQLACASVHWHSHRRTTTGKKITGINHLAKAGGLCTEGQEATGRDSVSPNQLSTNLPTPRSTGIEAFLCSSPQKHSSHYPPFLLFFFSPLDGKLVGRQSGQHSSKRKQQNKTTGLHEMTGAQHVTMPEGRRWSKAGYAIWCD